MPRKEYLYRPRPRLEFEQYEKVRTYLLSFPTETDWSIVHALKPEIPALTKAHVHRQRVSINRGEWLANGEPVKTNATLKEKLSKGMPRPMNGQYKRDYPQYVKVWKASTQQHYWQKNPDYVPVSDIKEEPVDNTVEMFKGIEADSELYITVPFTTIDGFILQIQIPQEALKRVALDVLKEML